MTLIAIIFFFIPTTVILLLGSKIIILKAENRTLIKVQSTMSDSLRADEEVVDELLKKIERLEKEEK